VKALILLALFQRLPDDFVFVRAREIPQEALARSLVNERCKSSQLRTPPGMQLDRIHTMIDALLIWTSRLAEAKREAFISKHYQLSKHLLINIINSSGKV
jgi:hypothetical protein